MKALQQTVQQQAEQRKQSQLTIESQQQQYSALQSQYNALETQSIDDNKQKQHSMLDLISTLDSQKHAALEQQMEIQVSTAVCLFTVRIICHGHMHACVCPVSAVLHRNTNLQLKINRMKSTL